MQNVNRQLNKTGKRMQSLGSSLTTGLTLPLVALGTLGIAKFAEFEDAMAKVKAISGATGTEFEALEKDAKKLGETTRFTASEVAALQLNYSKLGFNPDEIVNATKATLDLALATGEDLANSAIVAASTLRGFGLEAAETNRVVDVMAASFSASALSLDKFQTAMAVLAPVAKNAGLSIEDATGQLAVLVNAGIDASTAGTGLRNIYLDLAGSGQTLEGALSQISNATNTNAAAFNLFGKRGATVAAVLAQNYKEAQKFSIEFQNAGGSAAEMAAIMDNTLKGSFFRLKSAFEGAAISLGEQLAPLIQKFAGYLTDMLGKFNELSPTTKKFIVVLGGIAAAIGPLLALAGTILPAIATGFAILTGPIGLIVAGLTAIGVVIYKNWQPIKKTLIDIANYFIDLYNESTAFRIVVQSVISTFKLLWEAGKFAFEGLKSILKNFVSQFTNGFKTIGKIIAAVFKGEFSTIPDIIKQASVKGRSNFKELTTDLKGDWDGLMKGIKTVTEDTLDAITTKKKIKFLSENVDATQITDAVSEATKKGVVKGLQGATGGGAAGRKKETSVASGLKSVDVVNPLATTENLITGSGLRIKETFATINENAVNFGQILSESVQQGLAGAIETFGSFLGALATGGASLSGLFNGLMSIVAKFIEGLGKAMVQAGLASIAFKSLFVNPFASIAAGGALIALAAVVKGFLKGGFQDAGAFATGGIVGGSSYYGDKLLARVNSGEAIFNQEQQKRLYSLTTQSDYETVTTTRQIVEGDKLILVTDRAKKKIARRS